MGGKHPSSIICMLALVRPTTDRARSPDEGSSNVSYIIVRSMSPRSCDPINIKTMSGSGPAASGVIIPTTLLSSNDADKHRAEWNPLRDALCDQRCDEIADATHSDRGA